MTYDRDLHLVAGDTPELAGGVSANLLGADVAVHTQPPTGAVIVTDADVVDPAAGTWRIAYADGDLTELGWHYVEVQVTYGDGRVQTFQRDSDTGQLVRFWLDAQYA